MSANSDLDVAYVARLARVNLTEDEAKIFQKQLGDVLKYVRRQDRASKLSDGNGMPQISPWRTLEKPCFAHISTTAAFGSKPMMFV